MKQKNGYHALTPEEGAIAIIKKCFEREKKGDKKARKKAILDLRRFLVKTNDGSYTLNSDTRYGVSETMHTYHGALKESLEKFVKPAKLEGKKEVRILDICSGLGYNAASCIEFLDKMTKIEMDMVEISAETLGAALLIENPLKSYKIIKRAVEEKLYEKGYLRFKFNREEISDRLNIRIYIEDARKLIKKLHDKKKYDAVFLDPFSPLKCPELYTLEFFLKLRNLLKDDGIILTYTSAAPVRSAMVQVGLYVGEGPLFGRKSGGTIASKNSETIEKSLSMDDERMIALSDAGIPFRDPKLNSSSEEIIKRRENERKSVRGIKKFASTVKTPIYLGKSMKNSRLKRRVLRNIKMLGIDDLNSEEARFIICPQFNECICNCRMGKAKIPDTE
ncbi:MAG: MnmC family methyltransferase [Methanobacteriaceae archaeon]|jgi:tRNA U34 5-methylaminomethyl-2-thiouridine-forming methyltransferase MnmC